MFSNKSRRICVQSPCICVYMCSGVRVHSMLNSAHKWATFIQWMINSKEKSIFAMRICKCTSVHNIRTNPIPARLCVRNQESNSLLLHISYSISKEICVELVFIQCAFRFFWERKKFAAVLFFGAPFTSFSQYISRALAPTRTRHIQTLTVCTRSRADTFKSLKPPAGPVLPEKGNICFFFSSIALILFPFRQWRRLLLLLFAE